VILNFYTKLKGGIYINSLDILNCDFLSYISLHNLVVYDFFRIRKSVFHELSEIDLDVRTPSRICFLSDNLFKEKAFICISNTNSKVKKSNYLEIEFCSNKFSAFSKLFLSDLIKKVNFYKTEFSDSDQSNFIISKCLLDYSNTVFHSNLDFHSFFSSNVHIKFHQAIFFKKVTFEINENNTLDLSNADFKDSIFFRPRHNNDKIYKKITLGLYNLSYTNFFSKSREISEINLLLNGINKKKQNRKDLTEKQIAERRVFRKILQDLHWGDYADEEYAKIMDLQLDLKFQETGNTFGNWWEKWIYQKAFGWGVRMQNIIWTSIVFIGFFSFVYLIYDILAILYLSNFESLKLVVGCDGVWGISQFRFAIWNTFLLADAQTDLGWIITLISTIQGVLGIVYVTILVAIISRKFMRM
jgi:uncharacterized protein YjbI with pentapeptide repeats